MSDNFELYLPSNVETEGNTAARFTVRLPETLSCLGTGWECALKEIFFPLTWHNVPERDSNFAVDVDEVTCETSIEPGYYERGGVLTLAISRAIQDTVKTQRRVSSIEDCDLIYHARTGQCTIRLPPGVSVRFSSHMAIMLGLSANPRDSVRVSSGVHTSPMPMDLSGGIDAVFVESDLVTTTPVGEKQMKILRVVPIPVDGKFGDNEHHLYDDPVYLGLGKREFSTIDVRLQDGLGRIMPFSYGKTTILVHFRRRYPPPKTKRGRKRKRHIKRRRLIV